MRRRHGRDSAEHPSDCAVQVQFYREHQRLRPLKFGFAPADWHPSESAVQASGLTFTFLRPNLYMQGLLNFRQSIQQKGVFFAAANDACVSEVDVRDLAEVAVAALTTSEHENRIYSLTGPAGLLSPRWQMRSRRAVGRAISFVDVPPESMGSALVEMGLPAWQVDGLLEEFAMYRRGEAAAAESGIREALGRPPRSFGEFARDYASLFG